MHHQLMLIVNNVDELRAVSEATKPDIIALLKLGLTNIFLITSFLVKLSVIQNGPK